MKISLHNNYASGFAARQLSIQGRELSQSLLRFTSGQRVNSAADDAAALAVNERLTMEIRGNRQGVRALNDGISIAQTVDSSLGQLSSNLQRIRELAVQSANGSLQDNHRAQLQKEVDQLTQEVSRIVATTHFNGTALLSGGQGITLQTGWDAASPSQLTTSGIELSTLAGFSADLTATGVINISNFHQASASISAMDVALNTLTQTRSEFGALQNRFETLINDRMDNVQNLESARSRIMDTDFAYEKMVLTRGQVLQQSTTSLIAQANSVPQSVISLLRG